MGSGWHFLDDYALSIGIQCPIAFILGPNGIDGCELLRCNQLLFSFSELNGDRATG